MNQIDASVTARVRAVLGPLYDELLGVMIDLATPPIFLMVDDRPRLTDVRDRAATRLRAWVTDHPDESAALVDLLPQVMQLPDAAESLLETAPWDDYFHLPPSTFGLPTGSEPVFSALPFLLDRADDDGLLDVEGLDARPHGLLVDGFSLHYHQLLRRGFGSNIHCRSATRRAAPSSRAICTRSVTPSGIPSCTATAQSKAYDRAVYPTDLGDFPRRGKGLHYRKVFRLDGRLSANEWSHVTALWFSGNGLVLEYLTGLTKADPAA